MRLSRLAIPSLFVLSSLALTGCAGFKNAVPLPNASALVNPGRISGSNFGGHSPLAGAHVFVLEATASSSGYGGKATSLLSYTAPGAVLDYTGDAATNPTYGRYFVPTSATGGLSITGDYTCSTGDPVYLYAQGGSTTGAAPVTASVTQAVVATDAANSSLQTVTFTAAQNFVAGQQVTLSGFTGATFVSGLQLASSILSTGLSSTQFEVTIPAVLGVTDGTYTTSDFGTGAIGVVYPGTNPQIVNLAMLGLCPGTPNEFATTLSYIYMNEVSTVAMANAMAGFQGNQSGADVGAPTTNLVGLQHAALNAGQLYDIQGGNVGTSTDGTSDAHVARVYTPGGNGIVPQAAVDTLGNILAACVDSANTYNPYALTPAGTQSPQCTTLFSDASSNGGASGGTVAPDTAAAAFNIARLPAGATTATNFVSGLYGLQGTSYPFGPKLAAPPNDFTLAIQYPYTSTTHPAVTNPAVNQAENIGIDGNGDVWINSHANNTIAEFSSLGVLKYQSPAASYSYGYISVDPSGNVWTGGSMADAPVTKFTVVTSSAGVQTITPVTYKGEYPGGWYDPYLTVTDSSGNAYVGGAPANFTSQWTLSTISSAGAVSELYFFPVNAGYQIAHGAVDGTGYVWLTTENGSEVGRYSESTGQPAFPPLTAVYGNGVDNPEGVAIDSNHYAWFANQHTGQASGSLERVTGTGLENTFGGGTQDNPYGVAIDGLDHVWMTNRCLVACATSGTTGPFSSILEFDNYGNVISPTTNYTLGGQISHPYNIAVDPSGVIWLTSYDSSMVGEVLGPGAPTVTPLSTASGSSGLGARP
jgi:streptogramin lyase